MLQSRYNAHQNLSFSGHKSKMFLFVRLLCYCYTHSSTDGIMLVFEHKTSFILEKSTTLLLAELPALYGSTMH